MEPSDTGTSERASSGNRTRPPDRVQRIGGTVPKRTIRVLIGVEATTFLLAAAIHAGVLVQGYEHYEAMLAESVIGTVLLLGLVSSWVRPWATFTVALGVQAFALLGTLVGIWTIIVGIGPRTVPDIAYHAIIVIVLAGGIGLAWRGRATRSGGMET